MTTKQYLNQIDRINRAINNKLTEIYQLKSLACRITVAANENKVQASTDKDRLGSAVAKIVDVENRINQLIEICFAKKEMIINQIQGMEDTMHYQVLFSRYIERKSFEEIANDNNYSARQIIRIHGHALAEFEKKYGESYK